MRVGFLICACLLVAATARADYPLVVTQEIQIPANRPWDVQHVTSDSTFGYAYIANDSIYWTESLGEPLHVTGIPVEPFVLFHTLCYYDSTPPGHQRITLLRIPNQGDDICALIRSEMICWEYWDGYSNFIYWLINLETGSPLGSFYQQSYNYWDNGAYGSGTRYSRSPILWPSLPQATSVFYLGSTWETYMYKPGGFETSTHDECTVFFDLRGDSLIRRQIDSSANISLFAGSSPAHVALGGMSSYSWRHDPGGSEPPEYGGESSTWLTTYTMDSAASPRFEFPTAHVIAQVDGDGTQRIIARYMTALDPNNFEQLWTIPEISNVFYAVRMYDSADERILAKPQYTNRFRVYNATDGSLLGETSTIIGDIAYVLKPAGREHEIVTWEVATRTIRVYTSQPPGIDGLTIAYLPEDNLLRLSWPEVGEATGYKIYTAPTADGPWEWIVGLPSGQTVYHIPANDSLRFFQVTVEFGE